MIGESERGIPDEVQKFRVPEESGITAPEAKERSRPLLTENEQRFFADPQHAWVIQKIVKQRDTGQGFSISDLLWEQLREEYGMTCSQQDLFARFLEQHSNDTYEKLRTALQEAGDVSYGRVIEALKQRGLQFSDLTSKFMFEIAHYHPESNRLQFRETQSMAETGTVTLQHEVIHAAAYNLPPEMKKKLDAEIEEIRKIVKEEYEAVAQLHELSVLEKYTDANINYGLSNADEFLAHLTNPRFREFLADLGAGALVQKTRTQRVSELLRKPPRKAKDALARLEKLKQELFDYWLSPKETEAGP